MKSLSAGARGVSGGGAGAAAAGAGCSAPFGGGLRGASAAAGGRRPADPNADPGADPGAGLGWVGLNVRTPRGPGPKYPNGASCAGGALSSVPRTGFSSGWFCGAAVSPRRGAREALVAAGVSPPAFSSGRVGAGRYSRRGGGASLCGTTACGGGAFGATRTGGAACCLGGSGAAGGRDGSARAGVAIAE